MGWSIYKRNEGGNTEVESFRITGDEFMVDQVCVLLDAKMTGADQTSPVLTILAWWNAYQFLCVQCGNPNFRNLMVCTLVRLDVNADEDYRAVKVKGRR